MLALPKATFRAMVGSKPDGFGEQPGKYHSDAIFLMGDAKAKDAFRCIYAARRRRRRVDRARA